MKKGSVLQTLAIVLVLVLAITIFFLGELGSFIASVITAIVTLIGAIAIWFQLRRNGEVASTEIVAQLNKLFNKSDGLIYMRDKLMLTAKDEDFSHDGILRGKDITKKEDSVLKDDDMNAIEYLEFFEHIALLVLDHLLQIKNIDDCFGNNFFYAVNNAYIQNDELVPFVEHYVNIVKLHKVWSTYRAEHMMFIPYSETCLSKVLPDYEKIAGGHV